MGTKFRPGIDGQLEPASIRDFDLLYHQRDEPDKACRCLRHGIFAPSTGKKEEHDLGSIERKALVRPELDAKILC
jgi:hypothetical protein